MKGAISDGRDLAHALHRAAGRAADHDWIDVVDQKSVFAMVVQAEVNRET